MRHFTRIPFQASTVIRSPDGSQEWPCELIDISLKGALTTRPEGWQARRGDSFVLRARLDEEGDVITMEADVAHVEDGHVGFECMHMDLDSATHLRRLVELNLGSETLLERELAELIKTVTSGE